MKAKLATVTLVGLLAGSLAVAQNNPAGGTPAGATSAAAVQTGAVIPLIQFQDVPLTTAIENLARQAGINYILDPKVSYGQPDEKTGAVKVQPNISIRWENLTAEQALSALLQNWGLQIVDDPKTKISRVTVKDPAAPIPLETRVIQLKFAAPSNILTSVQTVLSDKRSKVVADVRTSQLVVSATESEQEAVDKLVASLDTQTKQVLIEARLLETSVNPKTSKGINWSGTLEAQNLSFGNNVSGGQGGRYSQTVKGEVDPVLGGVATTTYGDNNLLGSPRMLIDTARGFNPATAFLDADGASAVLSFINQNSDSKVVSEPRTVTLDNQKATIEVGQMYPIVNVTASTANTSGGSQIAYSNLTVRLEVTPRISANNFVNLMIETGVTRLGPKITSKVASQNNEVDSFFKRSTDTSVLIPSGNTLVMGGMISDEYITSGTKVPLFGDLPILGNAFRSSSKNRTRNNLIIFITPTIVQNDDFTPMKSTFLKTPDPTKDLSEPDWSAWDSAKPLDWKKPILDDSYKGHRDPTK